MCARASGVPQCSVLGSMLFRMYVFLQLAMLYLSITFITINMQTTCSYRYVPLNSTDFDNLSSIESCASDVLRWFIENALLLNRSCGFRHKPTVVTSQQVARRPFMSQELMCSSLTTVLYRSGPFSAWTTSIQSRYFAMNHSDT